MATQVQAPQYKKPNKWAMAGQGSLDVLSQYLMGRHEDNREDDANAEDKRRWDEDFKYKVKTQEHEWKENKRLEEEAKKEARNQGYLDQFEDMLNHVIQRGKPKPLDEQILGSIPEGASLDELIDIRNRLDGKGQYNPSVMRQQGANPYGSKQSSLGDYIATVDDRVAAKTSDIDAANAKRFKAQIPYPKSDGSSWGDFMRSDQALPYDTAQMVFPILAQAAEESGPQYSGALAEHIGSTMGGHNVPEAFRKHPVSMDEEGDPTPAPVTDLPPSPEKVAEATKLIKATKEGKDFDNWKPKEQEQAIQIILNSMK